MDDRMDLQALITLQKQFTDQLTGIQIVQEALA